MRINNEKLKDDIKENIINISSRISDIQESLLIYGNIGLNRPATPQNFDHTIYSICLFLAYAQENAYRKNQTHFIGIEYANLELFIRRYFELETVKKRHLKRKLKKICKIGFVKETIYKKKSYYAITSKHFICYKGYYMIPYKGSDGEPLYHFGFCNISPYCKPTCSECILDRQLTTQIKEGFENIPNLSHRIANSPFFIRLQQLILNRNKIVENFFEIEEKMRVYSKVFKINIKVSSLSFNQIEKYGGIFNETLHMKELSKKPEKQREIISALKKLSGDFSNTLESGRTMERLEKPIVLKELSTEQLRDVQCFDPNMSPILNFLSYGEILSKHKNEPFPGFSIYQLNKMTYSIWLSTGTIMKKIYVLAKLGWLSIITYPSNDPDICHVKNQNFYKINNRFFCYHGVVQFPFFQKFPFSMYSCICPNLHTCDKSPQNCTFPETLQSFYQNQFGFEPYEIINSEFYRQLRSQLDDSITLINELPEYKRKIRSFLRNNWKKIQQNPLKKKEKEIINQFSNWKEIYHEFSTWEIINIGQKFVETNPFIDKKDKIEFIWKMIFNIFQFEFDRKRQLQRKANATSKVSINTDEIKKKILEKIFDTSLTEKISLEDSMS